MWWPVWMVATCVLMAAAMRERQWYVATGLLIVLGGLLASRLAGLSEFPWLTLMMIWAVVSVALLNHRLYVMAVFAGLSASSYYVLWGSPILADVFGALMLLSAFWGIYEFNFFKRRGAYFAGGPGLFRGVLYSLHSRDKSHH